MNKASGEKRHSPTWMTRLFGILKAFPLKDLAPEEDANLDAEETAYYRCIRTALRNHRINNVALTGPYGCGKSTILRTFEKHFGRGHKFLSISLATFGKDASEAGAKGRASRTDAKAQHRLYHVEHSILQQIFYQVPKRTIPRSRFKRISLPRMPLLLFVCFIVWLFCLGCAIAVLSPETLKNILVLHSFIQQLPQAGNTWLSIAALGTLLIPAFGLSRFLNTITLRKLNLKACEIEIAEEKDPSVLNKHLDEILYFFEATRYDVVAIEDLDRFETPDIFTKLREINTLINRNIQARNRFWWPFAPRKRVVFIYAIRDEMFTGEERTKFFDLIIPVVPVVNYANSRDLLRRELSRRRPERPFDISEVLLEDIARYVPDMRLLYNIVNEFAVYRERLNMDGLRDASLLAMMVYKNVFPKDFADLQGRRGLLYEYFKQKSTYRKERLSGIESEISEKREILRRAKTGTEESLEELRILYLNRIRRLAMKDNSNWTPFSVVIGGSWEPFDAVLQEDTFEEIMSANQVQVLAGLNNRGTNTMRLNFADAWTGEEQQTYAARKGAILARDEAVRGTVEREIGLLQEEAADVRNAKIAQLLDRGNLSPLDAAPYLRDDDEIACERKGRLLHLLLRQGYINETYESYLSYFYEGTLQNQDRVFVMSVKNANPLDPDYELTNVAEIVGGQLTTYEAEAQATKNIHILDFMLDTPSLSTVVARLRGEPQEAAALLTLHLRTSGLRHALLIQRVYQAWPELWDVVQETSELSPSERDFHLSGIIMYADEDLLKAICSKASLQQYISERDDFIAYVRSLDVEARAIAFLKVVHPEFSALSGVAEGSALSSLVYEESMYAVSGAMVSLMYRTFIGEPSGELPPTITAIRAAESSPLCAHIEQYLETYLAVLTEYTDALTRESEETVIWLLNNNDVSHDRRLEVASGLCVPITRLEDIEQDAAIWGQLLESTAVAPSWKNVWAYMRTVSEGTLDEALIVFLRADGVASQLARRPMEDHYLSEEDDSPSLATLILSCPALETTVVSQLIEAIPSDYSVQDVSVLHQEYVPLIVRRKQVMFTVENFSHIRGKCWDSLGEFVKNNRDAFLAQVSEVQVDGEDLGALLAAHQGRNQKKQIAEAVLSKGIPEGIEAVADELCRLMLQDAKFAETLDLDAITTILVAAQDRALKIEILTLSMDSLQDQNITTILGSIGGDYGRLAKYRAWRRLKKTPINEKLAVALKKRGYVSSFKIKKDVIRINTYAGERPTEAEAGAAE